MSRKIVETHTIYKFNELSEDAQKRAWGKHLESDNYPWYSENQDVLKAFNDHFTLYSCEYYSDDITRLRGVRLATYLYNNYIEELYKGVFIWNQKTHKSKHSKCLFELSCPFTGYAMDMAVLTPVLKFISSPNEYQDIRDIFQECRDNLEYAIQEDIDDYYSFDRFKEDCIEQDLEFYNSGDNYYG